MSQSSFTDIWGESPQFSEGTLGADGGCGGLDGIKLAV